MKYLSLFLRRLLIVFLVGTFISVSTFRGEAIADDDSGQTTVTAFVNSCTLQRQDGSPVQQPDFHNPRFADADKGLVTLRATKAEFTLEGNGKGEDTKYDGYLYGAMYTDRKNQKQNLPPTYTPPVIEVSPSKQPSLTPTTIANKQTDKKEDNYLNVKLINDLPVNVQLAGSLPQTIENLESVSQYTNIHYHGFNVSPLLGGDDVLVEIPSNVTPNSKKIPIDSTKSSTEQPYQKSDINISIEENSSSDKVSYSYNVNFAAKKDGDAKYKLIPVPPLGDTTPDSNKGKAGDFPGGFYPPNKPTDEPDPTKYGGPISEYNMGFLIPDVHQSGLFWYHSHAHTLSDDQVRAGLSGGIIVKGGEEYYKQFSRPEPPSEALTKMEKLIRAAKSKYEANSLTPEIKQQVMLFKDFNDTLGAKEEDCFTLNDQVNPKITIKPGEIQLWRIGNIGADQYMNIALETLSAPTDRKTIIGAAKIKNGTISNSTDKNANGSITSQIRGITIKPEADKTYSVEGNVQVENPGVRDKKTSIIKNIVISNATVTDYKDIDLRVKKVSFTLKGTIEGETKDGSKRTGTIEADVKGTRGSIAQFTEPNKNPNFYILARDSNVVDRPIATDSVLLPPAARVELLVVGGEVGSTYNLVSDLTTNLTEEQQKWAGKGKSYLLATVNVGKGSPQIYEYTDKQQNKSKVSVCEYGTTDNGNSCKDSKGTATDTINLDYFIKNEKPYKIDDILYEPELLAKLTDKAPENDNDLKNLGVSDQGLEKLKKEFGCDTEKDVSQCPRLKENLKKLRIVPSNEYCKVDPSHCNEPLSKNRYFYFSSNSGNFFVTGYPNEQKDYDGKSGDLFDGNRIDKISHVGDIEEWKVVNATDQAHVFHMHQLDFIVSEVDGTYDSTKQECLVPDRYNNYTINKNTAKVTFDSKDQSCAYTYPLETQGYRDVINLPGKSTTTIRIPFVNPFITGVFVYHCHILGHEDRGMMQNLKVINPKGYSDIEMKELKKAADIINERQKNLRKIKAKI